MAPADPTARPASPAMSWAPRSPLRSYSGISSAYSSNHKGSSGNTPCCAWGQTSTPALQVWECIQQVKVNIHHRVANDTLSSTDFARLVCVSYLAILSVFLFWSLYLSP